MRKLLLAGNYTQAHFFMVEHGLSQRDVVYAVHRDAVRGLSDVEVVRIGTWDEREDALEIERYLRSQPGVKGV